MKFALQTAAGAAISDPAAQALLAPTCRVKVTLDGVERPGCATYDSRRDTFQYALKTPRAISRGTHAVGLKVSALDGSGVVNASTTP